MSKEIVKLFITHRKTFHCEQAMDRVYMTTTAGLYPGF